MKAVSHFSCGATSAIATKMALDRYGPENVEILYADTGSEHPDNQRFLKECEEKLFHQKVTIVRSKKYNTIFEVFEDRRFLASPNGAPCTLELKKLPIREYLGIRLHDEIQIFGYDPSDAKRKRDKKFKNNNPLLPVWFPLIEKNISKEECLNILKSKGVKPPVMYDLGFSNANCIGCVKAENISYWQNVRKQFPEIFKWFSKFERQIGKKINGVPRGAAINKRYIKGVRHRLFLDELTEEKINPIEEEQFDLFCGYSCGGDE